MRVLYTVHTRSGVDAPVLSSTVPLAIGAAIVNWRVTEGCYLESVSLEFTGADIRYNDDGTIKPTYTEIDEEAYRIANHVANQVFLQAGCDAIDPDQVLWKTPEASPENENEERQFRVARTRNRATVDIAWAVRSRFDPTTCGNGYKHSAAHGYFADALRAASDFQRFELLYKVVEYFFSETGGRLDKKVSDYVTQYDAAYTTCHVRKLREFRNRSIHPRARKGHIKPENLVHVKDVRAELPQMQKLAKLLLDHPTF